MGTIPHHYTKIKKNGVQCCVCTTNQPWHQKSYAGFNALHTKRKMHWRFQSSVLGSIPHQLVSKVEFAWQTPQTKSLVTMFYVKNHAMHFSLVILILNLLVNFYTTAFKSSFLQIQGYNAATERVRTVSIVWPTIVHQTFQFSL